MKHLNEIVLVAAIIFVILFTLIFNSAYINQPVGNATWIIKHASILGIFAIGAGIVIIAGGIDLSSGSVIAFCGSICVLIMTAISPVDENNKLQVGYGIICISILATIAIGFLIGTFHTWLITVINLPPFVATLASLVGLRSLATILNKHVNDGKSELTINAPNFNYLGDQWWIPFIVFLVIGLLTWLLMSRTVIGRHLYALGGNEQAAKLSGIRTDRLKWLAYCIGSVTAAIAGVLITAKESNVDPMITAQGYELTAIAAAVVGGCSLQGGIGAIPGIMLGVVFLRVIIDAVAKIIGSRANDYRGLIVGLLVVLAVSFTELRKQAAAMQKQFFPGWLGIVTILIIAALFTTVTTIMVKENAVMSNAAIGGIVGVVVFITLFSLRIFQQKVAQK